MTREQAMKALNNEAYELCNIANEFQKTRNYELRNKFHEQYEKFEELAYGIGMEHEIGCSWYDLDESDGYKYTEEGYTGIIDIEGTSYYFVDPRH